MGSLLPGWSSSPSQTEKVMKRSSSSLTKEEVEKFWKSKRLLVQEHLDEANKDAAMSPRTRLARAISEELEAQQRMAQPGGVSISLPEANSWWTKSRWAFLNDPPVIDVKQSKYVPQFDVATLGQLQTETPAF